MPPPDQPLHPDGAPCARVAAASGIVDEYFGGDFALYHEFLADCAARFPVDVRELDTAYALGDVAAVRRVAHTLKTVLQTLGEADASGLAGAIEALCAGEGPEPSRPLWSALRARLMALSQLPSAHRS